jgi:hypothetical protein
MNDFEKWYQFCMICPFSYKQKDDADTVYCKVNENYCPYRDAIEMAERKEE